MESSASRECKLVHRTPATENAMTEVADIDIR